jgi:DNA mismatch repair protein MutL
MPVIHTLPDDVARRIAAGEVVERPASVIKELFENAVDAGARSITVMTVGGGESLIEVRDDGSGMSREDVEMAPRNFSTSKISDAADLERIATYGFRGEALASISAVSRFELISSNHTKGDGWRVKIEGKEAIERGPAPQARGTTVRVNDLFFNTPARKRFLKSSITERKRILETILAFALILPGIEIHYIDDGRHVLDLLPAPSWRERIAAVLGATTMRQMVEVEATSGPMRVRGFVSLPSHTRGNRFSQFFFVNNRSVRERTLVHALQDAYRNVIPYKRYPVAVLAVEMPAADVDVNVHPSKLEVRVRNERVVFSAIRGAVKQALTARSEAALAVGVGRRAVEETAGITAEAMPWEDNTQTAMFAAPGSDARIRDAFSDYGTHRGARAGEKPMEPAAAQMSTWPPATITSRDAALARGEDAAPSVPTDDTLYWQFNQTYIFIQVRGGVVVIDQHAAHERVIFDWSMRLMQDAAPPSQQILFSIPIELSLRELEVFKTSRPVFQKLGFTLEPFGGTSILVRGYPQGLKNWADGHLLRQIFDDIIADKAPGNTLNEKLIASYACRSAIKAGQRLSVEEMKLLADQLFAVDNPYSCPHGRPTIYRLSLDEIARWFHRR